MQHPKGSRQKRTIAVHTDKGTRHYPVVSVDRTLEPNAYLLHIDTRGDVRITADRYKATIRGKREGDGTLVILKYHAADENLYDGASFSLETD